MMRWLCAAFGHQGHTIMERGKDGRLWTRCLNCWTVSQGIQIGHDDKPKPADDAAGQHGIRHEHV